MVGMMSHPETKESNSLMRKKWGNEQTAETRGWLVGGGCVERTKDKHFTKNAGLANQIHL